MKQIILGAACLLVLGGCVNDEKKREGSSGLVAETALSQTGPVLQSGAVPGAAKEIKSLMLTIGTTALNKEENTTVQAVAEMKDGSQKDVTADVTWSVDPKDAVVIGKGKLTAKKDVPTKIRAKIGTVESNEVDLDITWVVNGHTLPPEPDKTLNDSTLIGIDVNGNGVRDDVERWIYETYKDKHPIHIDIAMQAARAYKLVFEHPERAKEIHDEVSAASFCESYYKIYAKYFNEPILVKKDITNEFFRSTIIFNTKERKDQYLKYDLLLSGDSYTTPKIGEGKNLCDFNLSK